MRNFLPFFSKQPRRTNIAKLLESDSTYTINIKRFSIYALLLVSIAFVVNIPLSNNINTISLTLYGSYGVIWFVVRKNSAKWGAVLSKLLIMVFTQCYIFSLDVFLGKSFGAYFYYFAIVIAFINVFHWKNEKFEIISQSIGVPVALMLTSEFTKWFFFGEVVFNTTNQALLYTSNLYISFVLVGFYIVWGIYKNSSLQNKSVDLELSLTTLLSNSNANIRTLNTSYEVLDYNDGFAATMQQLYNVKIKDGFNIQYELFANENFPVALKESHVRAMCGERVTTEYKVGEEYFELIAAPLEKGGDIKGIILYDRNITEKKRKTAALKQSALDLKTLIDNTQGSIWSINNRFEIITANENFVNEMKNLFQVNVYVGYNCRHLFMSSIFPENLIAVYNNVMSGETINLQYNVNDSHFQLSARPLCNDNNEIVGATFYNNNVSANKFNEVKVDQLSRNLQSLIDNTADSIWSIDSNYKLTAANSNYKNAFKQTFGMDVITGFNLKNTFKHPNCPTEWINQYATVLSGEAIDIVYEHNSKVFKLNAKPIHKQNVIVGAAFFASDITESYTASKKIQQSEINLQNLINNNSGHIWGISADYKLLACNEHFATGIDAKFGVTVSAGYDIRNVFALNNYPTTIADSHYKVLKGDTVNFILETDEQAIEVTGTPINIDGCVAGAAFYAEDITLKKQHEKALITAKEKAEEASRTKARFLSNMSHELRTPLNGVIGITNILCDEAALPSQQKNLELLKYSSDLMYSIINDILDFSKIDEGKIVLENTPFNLQTTIERTSVIFNTEAKKKGLEFKVTTNDIQDLSVIGDVTRVRQVLNNLITNAIKFTEKGTISVIVNRLKKATNGKAAIEFSIADTGIGISADKVEHIFDSFTQADVATTRKYGGTGLGLTISKRLVDIMGGKLALTSTEGVGSTFTFILEFDTPQETIVVGIEQMKSFNNLRVLLAEDNRINMMVAKRQLEKWGIQVDEAENGEVACQKFMQNYYDVILMDMEMPVMDGLTATAKIREQDKETPIMALTAASFDDMHHFLREKGLNGYIKKPFSPAELNKKIFDAVSTTIEGEVLCSARVTAMAG